MSTHSTISSQDRIRQIAVTVSEALCVLGTLVGLGVLGTRVEESSGGALAADATLLAPAGPAFSIWSVIYLGLAAYTIWQWFPVNATTQRTRSTGWLVCVSMLLNAAWLLVTQQGWIWVSVVVIVALLIALVLIMTRLAAHPPTSTIERVVVDGTFGLYLGWVAVATCANLMAALVESGVQLTGAAGEWFAVVVLVAAAGFGALLARRIGPRYAVAGAMAWGLGWIAIGRLTDQPASKVVVAAAIIAALAVVAVTVIRWQQAQSRTPHLRQSDSAHAGR